MARLDYTRQLAKARKVATEGEISSQCPTMSTLAGLVSLNSQIVADLQTMATDWESVAAEAAPAKATGDKRRAPRKKRATKPKA